MINLTLMALSIGQLASLSPFLATSRSVQFSLRSSKFSHILSSIFLGIRPNTVHHIIIFDQLRVSNSLASISNCKELPQLDSADQTTFSGCITAADSQYTSHDTKSYEISGANLTVTNCQFVDCSGPSSLFELATVLIIFQNTEVSRCSLLFIDADPLIAGSQITNCIFESVNGILEVNSGSILFNLCLFDQTFNSKSSSYMAFSSCSLVEMRNCTFENMANDAKIEFQGTVDIRFDNVNMNSENALVVDKNSYIMILNSCFKDESIFQISGVPIKRNVVTGHTCPYEEPSATLTSEKKAYAITTVVVFSVFFAALFITLIALVFCKTKEEQVKYGKLHDEGLPEPEPDPEEKSD